MSDAVPVGEAPVHGSAVSRVAVVTDSTADLPAGRAATLGVHVVPLRVLIGARSLVDGAEITPSDVARALREKKQVTTSRPAPSEFAAEFQRRLDAGAETVVCINISAALSGTWEAATLAAQDFPHGVVRVVDSRSTAAGLGYAVAAAARVAADGGSAARVQEAAIETIDRTRTLFYVDTLEYLRRGGRIGSASALLATSLSIKPLLQMAEGQIVALEKVRTASKAMARLVALAAATAGEGAVDITVHHLAASQRAAVIAAQLAEQLPAAETVRVAELGAVIAAHLGPGVIGAVVSRRP
jgi:DegV family protein with EDD domain